MWSNRSTALMIRLASHPWEGLEGGQHRLGTTEVMRVEEEKGKRSGIGEAVLQ